MSQSTTSAYASLEMFSRRARGVAVQSPARNASAIITHTSGLVSGPKVKRYPDAQGEIKARGRKLKTRNSPVQFEFGRHHYWVEARWHGGGGGGVMKPAASAAIMESAQRGSRHA